GQWIGGHAVGHSSALQPAPAGPGGALVVGAVAGPRAVDPHRFDRAEGAAAQLLAQGVDSGAAAGLESDLHGPVGGLGRLQQAPMVLQRRHRRLLEVDVAPRGERLAGQRHMGVDGGGDDDHLGGRLGVGGEQGGQVPVPDPAQLLERLGDVHHADQLRQPGRGETLQVLQVGLPVAAGADQGDADRGGGRHRCAPAGTPPAGPPLTDSPPTDRPPPTVPLLPTDPPAEALSWRARSGTPMVCAMSTAWPVSREMLPLTPTEMARNPSRWSEARPSASSPGPTKISCSINASPPPCPPWPVGMSISRAGSKCRWTTRRSPRSRTPWSAVVTSLALGSTTALSSAAGMTSARSTISSSARPAVPLTATR